MPRTKEFLRDQSDFDDRLPERNPVTVSSNGQTAFPGALISEPIHPTRVRLQINGVWYAQGTYFTLGGGSNQDLTWLDNGFTLDTDDEVFVDYFPAD